MKLECKSTLNVPRNYNFITGNCRGSNYTQYTCHSLVHCRNLANVCWIVLKTTGPVSLIKSTQGIHSAWSDNVIYFTLFRSTHWRTGVQWLSHWETTFTYHPAYKKLSQKLSFVTFHLNGMTYIPILECQFDSGYYVSDHDPCYCILAGSYSHGAPRVPGSSLWSGMVLAIVGTGESTNRWKSISVVLLFR